MSATANLQKLLTWLSPAFPVGAFAWSAGLETVIASGAVTDRATTLAWVDGILRHGSLRTDAIFFAHAYRTAHDAVTLQDLADLCLALTPAMERHDETTITGGAFISAAQAWRTPVLSNLPHPCPYPIAVGAMAAGHDIPLDHALAAWLTAAVHGQISVAVRLVPIGQTDGLSILAGLEDTIAAMAVMCQHATLDDIGGVAYAADIAQMAHETLKTRIFRS